MKSIDIHDNDYNFLLGMTSVSGKSLSDTLSELIGAHKPIGADRPIRGNHTSDSVKNPLPTHTPAMTSPLSKLETFLGTSEFLVESTALGRFTAILSWLHRENPNKFREALTINGKKRKYFALTETELKQSGVSITCVRIRSSPYFVVTNNDTRLKRKILARLMRVMGYDQTSIQIAVRAVWSH